MTRSFLAHVFEKHGLPLDDFAYLPPKLREQILTHAEVWEDFSFLLDAVSRLPSGEGLGYEARGLAGLERWEEALDVSVEWLQASDGFEAHGLHARLLAALERPEALERAQALLQRWPEEPGGYAVLGEWYVQQEKWKEAEEILLQAPGESVEASLGLMELYWRCLQPASAMSMAQALYRLHKPPQKHLDARALRKIRDFFQQARQAKLYHRARAALEKLERWEQKHLSKETHVAFESLAKERREWASLAQEHYGFDHWREGQLEILMQLSTGAHVLGVLPTGTGKSLCYQLPCLRDGGFTLVVSPLVSLMMDQLQGLPLALRDRAAALHSLLDPTEVWEILRRLEAGELQLLFIAPERLLQPPLLHGLKQAGLRRMVIDEAHCISLWGHDFRPDYLRLIEAHRWLGRPQLLLLTATAPPRVREDLLEQLGIVEQAQVIHTDGYRPNLHLELHLCGSQAQKLEWLCRLSTELHGSGIIYTSTRQGCEELAQLLQLQGLSAAPYHAGLGERAQIQDQFMSGAIRIIVATVAFGMGVDKADIRFILHDGLPRSLENYAQQIGRAGRDGERAQCTLLLTEADIHKQMMPKVGSLSVALLRAVYAQLRRHTGPGIWGFASLPQLSQELQINTSAIKQAVSLLAQCGILRWLPSTARRVGLQRMDHFQKSDRQEGDGDGEEFERFLGFVQRLKLRERGITYVEMDEQLWGAEPPDEGLLYRWQERGWISIEPFERQMLLHWLPPPDDAAQRISQLLEQKEATHQRRREQVVEWIFSERCRHGELGRFMGDGPRIRCQSCDRCLGLSELNLPTS